MQKPYHRIFIVLIATLGILFTSISIKAQENNPSTLPLPKTSGLIQVDAGFAHTCALKTDGTAACWGYNYSGEASAPSGTFTDISAGNSYSCGVKTDGTLSCWGGPSNLPYGTYRSVSAGGDHTCALRLDETLICSFHGLNTTSTYISFSAGYESTCGVSSDGKLSCMGTNSTVAINHLRDERFKSVSVGFEHACAVKTDDTLVCWGSNSYNNLIAPSGTFSSVSADENHTCAVRTDGTLVCWGLNNHGQTSAPSGTFRSVSAGGMHTCGIKTDNTVTCWGFNYFGITTPPQPNVRLASINPLLPENGSTTFDVDLSTLGLQNVTVNFAVSGTAELGSDYTLPGGMSTTIGVDSKSSTIQIVGIDDNLHEEDETIIIDIDSVVNGIEVGTQQITLNGQTFSIELPGGYRQTRSDKYEQHWGPTSGDGLTVQLSVTPRAQRNEGGTFVTPPCNSHDYGGVSSSSQLVDGIERETSIGTSICLEGTEFALACRAGHTRGYLEPSEKEAALALCKTVRR